MRKAVVDCSRTVFRRLAKGRSISSLCRESIFMRWQPNGVRATRSLTERSSTPWTVILGRKTPMVTMMTRMWRKLTGITRHLSKAWTMSSRQRSGWTPNDKSKWRASSSTSTSNSPRRTNRSPSLPRHQPPKKSLSSINNPRNQLCQALRLRTFPWSMFWRKSETLTAKITVYWRLRKIAVN